MTHVYITQYHNKCIKWTDFGNCGYYKPMAVRLRAGQSIAGYIIILGMI